MIGFSSLLQKKTSIRFSRLEKCSFCFFGKKRKTKMKSFLCFVRKRSNLKSVENVEVRLARWQTV